MSGQGTQERIRAYRYALDLTPAQAETLARHAGAARCAYNHAVAAKQTAHQEWRAQVEELVAGGATEAPARRQIAVLKACLASSGRRLLVVGPGELDDDLVRDVTEILTSLCARLYGRRAAVIRAARGVAAVTAQEPS